MRERGKQLHVYTKGVGSPQGKTSAFTHHQLKQDTMYAKSMLSCCHLVYNRPSLPHIYQQVLCLANVKYGNKTLAYTMEAQTNERCICSTRA